MYANIEASPQELRDHLLAFMDEHIYPNEESYHAQLNAMENRFQTVPLMEELKAKAQNAGLWNLFVPKNHGGLSNVDYSPLAEIMSGRAINWNIVIKHRFGVVSTLPVSYTHLTLPTIYSV